MFITVNIPLYSRVWLKEKAGRFRLISCKHILLEVDHAIWDVEILAEAPLIAGAQDGRNSGFEMVVDVCDCKVWKWFKKFGRLPCVEGTGEILARVEQSELL